MSNANTPFDKNMFFAIAAALALYLGWQTYLTKKYPEHYKKAQAPVTENQAETTAVENGKLTNSEPATEVKTNAVNTTAESQAEEIFEFKDDQWELSFSSKGMGLKSIKLNHFTDRKGNNIQFFSANDRHNFSTNVIGRSKDLDFSITRSSDLQFVGVAKSGNTKIIKTVTIDSKNYTLNTQIRVEAADDLFAGLTTEISDHVHPAANAFFLMPQYEFQEFYVQYDGTDERTILSHKEEQSKSYTRTTLIALSSQYFTTAIQDKSSVLPEFKAISTANGAASQAQGLLTYSRLNGTQEFNISYSAFAGPKSYRLLESIHADMAKVVNFGFFQSIAKVIFKVLDSIHNVVANWGLAIVLLTILVRLLVLPFNLMSYRSMKGMAAIQPQIKVLREKYKNDAQRLNQEMLQLMKEAKANPLGGCLPMLLQIPIFFALYQVLGQSIELYKAPFIFWIHDLSYRDPFFVLPILMGATLFIQQKITPTTMEPAQQKIMMFMPVIFSAFMLTLPSGLTLYIFVSGLFAVLQQLYFMRNDNKPGT